MNLLDILLRCILNPFFSLYSFGFTVSLQFEDEDDLDTKDQFDDEDDDDDEEDDEEDDDE